MNMYKSIICKTIKSVLGKVRAFDEMLQAYLLFAIHYGNSLVN